SVERNGLRQVTGARSRGGTRPVGSHFTAPESERALVLLQRRENADERGLTSAVRSDDGGDAGREREAHSVNGLLPSQPDDDVICLHERWGSHALAQQLAILRFPDSAVRR